MPDLSIIIVTYNSEDDISPCLTSLVEEAQNVPHEILVVDNNSKDQTTQIVREQFPYVTLIENEHNAGFPAANNLAIEKSTGRYILLLNPDTIILPGGIKTLMAIMEGNPRIGACGPRLIDEKGEVAPDIRLPTLRGVFRGVFFGNIFLKPHLPQDKVQILSGAALLTRRSIIDSLGALDAELFWREDVDFCYRVWKAGYFVRLVPDATIVHLIGRSAASNIELAIEKPISSQIGFFVKHQGRPRALAVTLLLSLQTCLRLLKWAVIYSIRRTPESELHFCALLKVLGRFPAYYRTAVLHWHSPIELHSASPGGPCR